MAGRSKKTATPSKKTAASSKPENRDQKANRGALNNLDANKILTAPPKKPDVLKKRGSRNSANPYSAPFAPPPTPGKTFKVELHVPEEARFTCFSKLPFELRKMIWKLAADEPRSVTISIEEYYRYEEPARRFGFYFSGNPAVLQVNKEARGFALPSYIRAFSETLGFSIYFNFAHDELFFDSRRTLVAWAANRPQQKWRTKYHSKFEEITSYSTNDEKMVTRAGMRFRLSNEEWTCGDVSQSRIPLDLGGFTGAQTLRIVLPQEIESDWYDRKVAHVPPTANGVDFSGLDILRQTWKSELEAGLKDNLKSSLLPTPIPSFVPDWRCFQLEEMLERSRYLTKLCILHLKRVR